MAAHVCHAGLTDGRRRRGHSGHVPLALGMIAMFLPAPLAMVVPAPGMLVCGLTAVAWLCGGRIGGLCGSGAWVIDLFWMGGRYIEMNREMNSRPLVWFKITGAPRCSARRPSVGPTP